MKKELQYFLVIIVLLLGSNGYSKIATEVPNTISSRPYSDWFKKAGGLEDKKDWAGLLTHSLHWTEAQPQEDAAWFSLGIAYGESEQFIEAIESFKHALNINRNNPDTWFNQGLIYSKIGQYVEAIDSFKQAVNIDREFTSAWVNLGITYYQVGRTSQVKEVYEILKKLDPSTAEEFNKLFIEQ
jgi:tetratricopeptide (TPR) repeat protein